MELDSNQRRTWCSSAVQQTAALSHSAIHPCRCWSRGGDSHPCRLHGTQASLLLNDRDVVEPRPGVEPGPAGLGNRLESASRGDGAPWSIRTAAFGFEARRSSTELRGQRVWVARGPRRRSVRSICWPRPRTVNRRSPARRAGVKGAGFRAPWPSGAESRKSMEPATGIEPAPLCLLGSRSPELSYAGVWYPAQESNPETAGFASPPEIRLARRLVREAGVDPAADGL